MFKKIFVKKIVIFRDTNSMVEEFMLLANVSVAKKIYDEFSQCAVLRRHPLPPYSNFDPMIAVCKAYVSVTHKPIYICTYFSRVTDSSWSIW